MSTTTPETGADWRRRMQDLARNVGRPHAPLFAPLTLAASAQIEALAVQEMVRDATRLRKGASELRRVLGLEAMVCAVPSCLELEAAGGVVDDAWPPRLVGAPAQERLSAVDAAALAAAPRLRASLEAVRQSRAGDAAAPVQVAALHGPAALKAQLAAIGPLPDDELLYERLGALLAALARLYAEAGVDVLQLHEGVPPSGGELDHWKGALGTFSNVARFHRVPPVLVFDHPAPVAWPVQVVACPSPAQHAGAMPRAHGRAWSAEPAHWTVLPGAVGPERYVTTQADLSASIGVADLKRMVERARTGLP